MEFKVIKTIYFSNSENNTGRDEEFEIQQEKTTTQYQKIPKGSEKTYICDGAILTCPNIEKDTILTASGEYDASQKISFLVTEPKALLMGIDPLGSDKDIKPENFSVSKTTKCEKSPSGFCEIKEKAVRWENTSELVINKFKALRLNSYLVCKVDPSVKVKFESNGQDLMLVTADLQRDFKDIWSPETAAVLDLSIGVLETGIGVAGLAGAGISVTNPMTIPIALQLAPESGRLLRDGGRRTINATLKLNDQHKLDNMSIEEMKDYKEPDILAMTVGSILGDEEAGDNFALGYDTAGLVGSGISAFRNAKQVKKAGETAEWAKKNNILQTEKMANHAEGSKKWNKALNRNKSNNRLLEDYYNMKLNNQKSNIKDVAMNVKDSLTPKAAYNLKISYANEPFFMYMGD